MSGLTTCLIFYKNGAGGVKAFFLSVFSTYFPVLTGFSESSFVCMYGYGEGCGSRGWTLTLLNLPNCLCKGNIFWFIVGQNVFVSFEQLCCLSDKHST